MVAKEFFVYIVECNDKTLYTGYTSDITRRLKEHNGGRGAKYTRGRGPVRLVYTERFETRATAMRRECEIKRLSRKDKLKLVEGERL